MRPERGERHKKPYVHARHAGQEASFDIESGDVIAGSLEHDDEKKVQAWISIHREDLYANWELLATEGTFFKIDPLR